MKKETTAMFIGHKECFGADAARVRGEIVRLIEGGITDFLDGGMGDFDMLCARTVYELKSDCPQIRCHLVIPYLTFKTQREKYFDSVIYPEGFEKYHFKAAIPQRNKYMVENSSAAVCYITHDWGGAAKTFELAQKAGIATVNVG